jgi:hypothetical protein
MQNAKRKISDREARAMAYALTDEIETRALELRRLVASLTPVQAFNAALAAMAGF